MVNGELLEYMASKIIQIRIFLYEEKQYVNVYKIECDSLGYSGRGTDGRYSEKLV